MDFLEFWEARVTNPEGPAHYLKCSGDKTAPFSLLYIIEGMETSPEEGTALSSSDNNTVNTGQLQQHESQANASVLPSQHRCNGCGRILKSSAGLKNHQRSCNSCENTVLTPLDQHQRNYNVF